MGVENKHHIDDTLLLDRLHDRKVPHIPRLTQQNQQKAEVGSPRSLTHTPRPETATPIAALQHSGLPLSCTSTRILYLPGSQSEFHG